MKLSEQLMLSMLLLSAAGIAITAGITALFLKFTHEAQSVLVAALVAFVTIAIAGTAVSKRLATQIEERIDETSKIAEKSQRDHKQWLTDTSHELRTPISVLRAQIEALQDGVQQVNAKTLAVLHGQISMLSKLVDDLNDLARSDVGELRYHFADTDICSILGETVETFRDKFARKQIQIETVGIDGEPHAIKADAARMKQVFTNLLENSWRYTNAEGRLRVSCTSEGNNIVIAIDDSPPAVPKEAIGRIFERFYRVEASRSRAYGGAGIGLALCTAIVKAHHGSVAASQSDLGGLRIAITLPAGNANNG